MLIVYFVLSWHWNNLILTIYNYLYFFLKNVLIIYKSKFEFNDNGMRG